MKNAIRPLLACLVAVTTVTCGPSGMEMIGDAMMDAGAGLRDAAGGMRDATIDAMDDTGVAFMDTGAIVRDGAGDDASAQCATCTPTGAARTITADTDPAQVLGETRYGLSISRGTEVAVGPLVVTDFAALPSYHPGSSALGPVNAAMFTVPEAELCENTFGFTVPTSVPTMRQIAFAHFRVDGTGGSQVHDVHGARILVPAGRRLCVQSSTFDGNITWAGYRPYD
jgi:hypothetical protein